MSSTPDLRHSSASDHESAVRPLPDPPKGWTSLARALVIQARAHWQKTAICDSTKTMLSYGQMLTRALVLSRILRRLLGPAERVGLLVPPSVPAAVTNLAVTLLGKTPVNLNYSASQAIVDSSIHQAEITHTVTSAKVLDRFPIRPAGQVILLEDLPPQVTLFDKLVGAALAKLAPLGMLGWFAPGVALSDPAAEATIIFTSGSTGDPKGVMLSQRNILANVRQIDEQVRLKPDEVLLGILPFFHAFGFTVTIWTALCLGKKVVYHFSPLDAKIVGRLCAEHRVSLLVASPSFARLYVKSCEPEQFHTITHFILGAEKLKPDLAREIRETIGIEPLEGYGCTEVSPVVSVNVPREIELEDGRKVAGNRPGTVGLPVPGTAVKTIDPETRADLPRGVEGIVCIKGPQVMLGYLKRPEATAAVIRDGWYITGDLGWVDEDGFLRITDRVSRFSKIAGEMVPHLGLEAAIARAAGVDEQLVVVTGVPDAKHGERLRVVHQHLDITPAEVVKRLGESNIPKVWIPSAADFIEIEEIPLTATGKVDLRKIKEIASRS
jgi:acyl-[acyl-carrier-protein]-phospholipid O-acyltransferase/long-chain-fatty-acid--[acyl-carrier-protein] ligase